MIAVVVPTIRPERMKKFRECWGPLFNKHMVKLFVVEDGDDPVCNGTKLSQCPQEWRDLVYSRNDGVRNFGFLLSLKELGRHVLQTIVTLDDDVFPYNDNDPIQEHMDALLWDKEWYSGDPSKWVRKVPISWFSTASEYMRGFPYGVREEAEVWVSHGVWQGVHDYDGPTQLTQGNKPATFYKGPIPRGCLTPICGMNLAFRIEALPWMYFAPMGKSLGVQRFADIWMGVSLKRELDIQNKAIVSGYSTVYHERASNVLSNLEQEAVGIRWNEHWQYGPALDSSGVNYFDLYQKKMTQWRIVVSDLMEKRK